MNNLYDYYYTGANTKIFVDHIECGNRPVMLDKAEGIFFSENFSSQPIYGVGDQYFKMASNGNTIVQGGLIIRFKDPRYLANAVKYTMCRGFGVSDTYLDDHKQYNHNAFMSEMHLNEENLNLSPNEFATVSDTRLRAMSASTGVNKRASILRIPKYFMFKIIYDSTTPTYKDNPKEILIKDVVVTSSRQVTSTSSDDVVNVEYGFIARSLEYAGNN